MKAIGIIPARYASSRFPGKPLAILGGKYVLQRVVEQVSTVLDDVYVATDDKRIYNTITSLGANAVMTSTDHQSGTDRIAEALEQIGGNFDVVVNLSYNVARLKQCWLVSKMLVHRLPHLESRLLP